MMMMMLMMMMLIMMLMMIIIIIFNWLRVWRISLEVTSNLITALSYSQTSSLKNKTVSRSDLDLALRS